MYYGEYMFNSWVSLLLRLIHYDRNSLPNAQVYSPYRQGLHHHSISTHTLWGFGEASAPITGGLQLPITSSRGQRAALTHTETLKHLLHKLDNLSSVLTTQGARRGMTLKSCPLASIYSLWLHSRALCLLIRDGGLLVKDPVLL